MARSTVRDLFADIAEYPHAILAFTDSTGHPLSTATSFAIDTERQVIRVQAPSTAEQPAAGAEVNVTFSHVRPYPGVGYDQRRYVTVWGLAVRVNGSLEITPARTHGWDEERLSFFELLERSVPVGRSYLERVSAARGEVVKPTMPLPWIIFLATRLPFLTATIVPILLGALIARSQGFSAWWFTVLALIGGSAIHLGLNIANDVSDATSGADEANVNPTMFSGGSRVIQYGLVSLRAMRLASTALYLVGIAIGLFLAAQTGPELLLIGAVGLFLSLAYTAPPFRLVHRGLGEVCVALGFGPVMVLGSYFVVAERLNWEAFYASLPVALLIMLVLYVNQIPDRPADATTGKRTIVVRLPRAAIETGYAVSVAVAFGLIVVGVVTSLMPVWTLLSLLAIPLAVQTYQGIRSYYESPYELMGPMGKNVALHFAAGMGLIAGYLIEVLWN